MKISTGLKVLTFAALIAAGSGQIEARRHHNCGGRPPRVVVHVPASRTVVTSRVSNRFSRRERLAMAIAYFSVYKPTNCQRGDDRGERKDMPMQLSSEEIRTQISLFLSKLGGDRGRVDISDYEFGINNFAEIKLNPKSINELDEGVYQFNG